MTPEAVAFAITGILIALVFIAARALYFDHRTYRAEQEADRRLLGELRKRRDDDNADL